MPIKAIHAFDGIPPPKQPLWLALIAELAAAPRMVFINEFLALLNRAEQFADAVDIQGAAKSARQFLSWIFTQARSMSPQKATELRDTGIGRILPFIIKTYDLGPDESKQIVLEILAGLGSPHSGPHEASRLAHEIATLVHFDAPLAVEVYERLFGHEEASKETTALGGPVFQMRSTRQQDFNLSLYNLQTSFKAFLSVSPIEAARAAINLSTLKFHANTNRRTKKAKHSLLSFLDHQSVLCPITARFGGQRSTRSHQSPTAGCLFQPRC